MFNKFSVWVIVKGQIESMRIFGSNKRDWIEIGLFFGLPLISPLIQYSLHYKLSSDTVSIIVSAASIFAGLLLNLLVLLYSILCVNQTKHDSPVKDNEVMGEVDKKERLLIEFTFYNISYAVLICVILIISSLLTLTREGWWITPAEMIFYYIGFQLFIAIAQILKRFHSLLEHKVARKIDEKNKLADSIWK